MIESTNGSLGIEVIRENDTICFIGHFKKGLTSKIQISLADAKRMFDNTGTIEVVNSNRQLVGLIGYGPLGTNFFFPPNQNYDLICVNSDKLRQVVNEVVLD